MLVTIYQVMYPGLKQVQQYYKWPFPRDPVDDRTLPVESCPGCGKNLGYLADAHKCKGTLTANPIDNRMHVYRSGRPKKQQDTLLRHYLASLDHPVVVSE